MNYRIKEIAEQALKTSMLTGDIYRPEGYANAVNKDFADKFAELLIKECAELIDNKVMITAAQTYDDVFVAVYDTNFANAKRIREHFGVEE